MTAGLTGPRLEPADGGAPRRLVVLLHGYGADGRDLMPLAEGWRGMMPEALFVAPNAPEPCAGSPFGYQWFAFDPEAPERAAAGARRARGPLLGLLGSLWEETGLAAGQTLICGFSQGAMMTLDVGLSLGEAALGLVAFSGRLVAPEGLEKGRRPKPPVCLVHGDADRVVPVSGSLMAAETLRKLGYEVALHLSEGAGHGIAPDGLAFATDFIAGLVAPATE